MQKGGTTWGYYNVQNATWQKVAMGKWKRTSLMLKQKRDQIAERPTSVWSWVPDPTGSREAQSLAGSSRMIDLELLEGLQEDSSIPQASPPSLDFPSLDNIKATMITVI